MPFWRGVNGKRWDPTGIHARLLQDHSRDVLPYYDGNNILANVFMIERSAPFCGWLIPLFLFILPCCAQQRTVGISFAEQVVGKPALGHSVLSGNQDLLEGQVAKNTSSRIDLRYSVLLPPSYRTEAKQSYPIIVWLHGANGGEMSLHPLSSQFRNAMESGLMREAIIIFPESKPLSMWVNSKGQDYMIEKAIVVDLLSAVKARYRVLRGPSNTTVAGFSMGGYGAARLGLKFPNIFGNVVMVGAGTLGESLANTPRADDTTRQRVLESVYGNSITYFYEQSPRFYAKQHLSTLKSSRTNLTIFAGGNDEVIAQNTSFYEYLVGLGLSPGFNILPGVSHNLRDYVRAANQSLFAALSR